MRYELTYDEVADLCAQNGYSNPTKVNGVWCATQDYITKRGIMVGVSEVGYDMRYCYQNRNEATAALASWKTTLQHPPGNWIKAKGRFLTEKNGELGWLTMDDLNPNWVRS
jgi:hypothetical protein